MEGVRVESPLATTNWSELLLKQRSIGSSAAHKSTFTRKTLDQLYSPRTRDFPMPNVRSGLQHGGWYSNTCLDEWPRLCGSRRAGAGGSRPVRSRNLPHPRHSPLPPRYCASSRTDICTGCLAMQSRLSVTSRLLTPLFFYTQKKSMH